MDKHLFIVITPRVIRFDYFGNKSTGSNPCDGTIADATRIVDELRSLYKPETIEIRLDN